MSNYKIPANLTIGDTFLHGTRVLTVTGEVTLAEMMPYTTRIRRAVPTNDGIVTIPDTAPVKILS